MFYQLSEDEIRKKVKSREVKIAVIGLGRVGLPLAATLADQGFSVMGIDIDEKLVSLINQGSVQFKDETGLRELVKKAVKEKKLTASSEIKAMKDCDFVTITVPTLITEDRKPEIKAVEIVARDIAKFSKGKVIVIESTVPPLTTQKFGEMITEKTGLKVGKDFGLAHSPERVRAPQVLQDLKSYPKIVGSADEKSALIVSEVYSTFAPRIIQMSSPIAAEIEKLMENTQRDVNIALVNELAKICEIYGVDVFEVIKAANSQPFCNLLSPGCGVGGHCIPMDPYYLIQGAMEMGYEPSLLKAAREINESMPEHTASIVKRRVRGGKITVLGLSFKPDVKAFKHSPALKIIDFLKDYDVVAHDPFLEEEEFDFKTERDIYRAIERAECVILTTAHSAYEKLDLKKVKKLMRGNLIVDGRGFFDPKEIKKTGLNYVGVGRIHD